MIEKLLNRKLYVWSRQTKSLKVTTFLLKDFGLSKKELKKLVGKVDFDLNMHPKQLCFDDCKEIAEILKTKIMED